jgi:hypothetical protein
LKLLEKLEKVNNRKLDDFMAINFATDSLDEEAVLLEWATWRGGDVQSVYLRGADPAPNRSYTNIDVEKYKRTAVEPVSWLGEYEAALKSRPPAFIMVNNYHWCRKILRRRAPVLWETIKTMLVGSVPEIVGAAVLMNFDLASAELGDAFKTATKLATQLPAGTRPRMADLVHQRGIDQRIARDYGLTTVNATMAMLNACRLAELTKMMLEREVA